LLSLLLSISLTHFSLDNLLPSTTLLANTNTAHHVVVWMRMYK
jgi:hypothetical protein